MPGLRKDYHCAMRNGARPFPTGGQALLSVVGNDQGRGPTPTIDFVHFGDAFAGFGGGGAGADDATVLQPHTAGDRHDH